MTTPVQASRQRKRKRQQDLCISVLPFQPKPGNVNTCRDAAIGVHIGPMFHPPAGAGTPGRRWRTLATQLGSQSLSKYLRVRTCGDTLASPRVHLPSLSPSAPRRGLQTGMYCKDSSPLARAFLAGQDREPSCLSFQRRVLPGPSRSEIGSERPQPRRAGSARFVARRSDSMRQEAQTPVRCADPRDPPAPRAELERGAPPSARWPRMDQAVECVPTSP
jgi:hypothetical protein